MFLKSTPLQPHSRENQSKNTVTVKQVLKASKVTVKNAVKKFTLKSTLKINGKLQKGKVITFKLNGKTCKVKTNKKDVAQKTLNKKVIKSSKKVKHHCKRTYKKDTIKTTVKAKCIIFINFYHIFLQFISPFIYFQII